MQGHRQQQQHQQQQQGGSFGYNMQHAPNQNYALPGMQQYNSLSQQQQQQQQQPAPGYPNVGAPVLFPPPGQQPVAPPQQMPLPQPQHMSMPPQHAQASPPPKSPPRDGDQRANGRQAKRERGETDNSSSSSSRGGGGDNKRPTQPQTLPKATCEMLSYISRLYVRHNVTAQRRKRLRELTEIFLQPADAGVVNKLVSSQSFTWFTHEDRETTLEGLLTLCEDFLAGEEA